MQSKISFFSRTTCLKNLTRFWPVWFIYIIIWTLSLPLPMLSDLRYQTGSIYRVTAHVLQTARTEGIVLGALLGLATAMAVWSYLYVGKSASFIASLPVRREGMFISNLLSGLGGIVGSNLIVFLLALGVQALYGAVQISYLLQWLATVTMSGVFFYGLATLCAMLTGNIIVLPLVYAVLNFVVVVVEVVVYGILSFFVYGMSYNGEIRLAAFSPIVKLFTDLGVQGVFPENAAGEVLYDQGPLGYYLEGWHLLGIYCAVGIIFMALALLLYRKRRMETASDVVAVRPLRPVFKYCVTGGCALVLGALLYSIVFSVGVQEGAGLGPALYMLVFMLIGCLIGYFAAEMMINKTFQVWRGNWGGFLVSALVITALLMAAELDLFGYERRLPELDSISDVMLHADGEQTLLSQGENIQSAWKIHQSIIENKGEYERRPSVQPGYMNLRLIYSLEGGKQFERFYVIPANTQYQQEASSDLNSLRRLFNTRESIDYRINPEKISGDSVLEFSVSYLVMEQGEAYYDYMTFSSQEAEEIYNQCILPDAREGTIGKAWLYDDAYPDSVYSCSIQITFAEKRQDGQYTERYFHVTPTLESERTNAWLEEQGIQLVLERKASDGKYGMWK